MSADAALQTPRLRLDRVREGDVDALYAVAADPRVWTHFPSLRPTSVAEVDGQVRGWMTGWEAYGLGMWTVRLADGTVLGYGGCTVAHERVWNLGYRLDADRHGRGYATEVARAAVAAARRVAPERPVTAYLVEHNLASAKVASKAGLALVHRGPDAGNPDPRVQRLVYSDRPLDPDLLALTLG